MSILCLAWFGDGKHGDLVQHLIQNVCSWLGRKGTKARRIVWYLWQLRNRLVFNDERLDSDWKKDKKEKLHFSNLSTDIFNKH